MLRALVVICGAALMGLELVGSRVLAPHMGSSIFVWAGLIGCFMMAMSGGYWLGGRLSDTRLGSVRGLGGIIALAGVLTAAIPMLGRSVLPPLATLGPRLGPLTASAVLFVAPALVLSFVSPIAVSVASRADVGVGRTAGRLYALSTGGSIVGTFATAFWLIPALTTDGLLAAIGLLLGGTGMVAALAPDPSPEALPAGRWLAAVASLAVAATVLGGMTYLPDAGGAGVFEQDVVFRADTQYHRITVSDHGTIRSMRFDDRRQSAIDMRDGYTSDIRYADYLHTAFALKPDAERVLVLGLGGGAMPLRILHDYPGMRVDCVEIDPVVVKAAHEYFGLPEDDPRLRVQVGDARQLVRRASERYDVVVIDAYYSDSMPFHLATEEFFRELDAKLAPGGVVAYNLISAVEGPRSELYRSMIRTIRGVWRETYTFPVDYTDLSARQTRNIVVLASDTRLSSDALRERVRSRVDGLVRVPEFPRFAEDLYTEPVRLDDVPVLTDQHAPTDALIHVD